MKIKNFGGNVVFEPAHYYEPSTEEEVLHILDRHIDDEIRVVASGHAWSPATQTKGVIICMDKISDIQIDRQDEEVVVSVGGGAVLRNIVTTIEEQTDHTLPTMGGILKQTIAGAISTSTHGSGRASLSSYIDEIRIAAYDSNTKKACIYEYKEGEALQATRCAVGCMGVILSVKFQCVPKYLVAETVTEVSSVEELFSRDHNGSLEQAILLPFSWRLLIYDRKIVVGHLSFSQRLRATLHSVLSIIYIDIGLHIMIASLVRAIRYNIVGVKAVAWLYGSVIPRAIRKNVTHVGESTDMLTLKHDLFRHLEMELFIQKHNLELATEVVTYLVAVSAGIQETPSQKVSDIIAKADIVEEVEKIKGTYIHHYPLYYRRIIPDDTMISMTSGNGEPYYSLSFFTYHPPGSRQPFYDMCYVIAKTLAATLEVRPHWGKYNPLKYEDIAHLYPRLDDFHRECEKVDPKQVFQNEYTRRVLGF